MTYEKIYDLKFKKNFPTYVLEKKFPHERRKISQVALLELPSSQLRGLISLEEMEKLTDLKHWLADKTSDLNLNRGNKK